MTRLLAIALVAASLLGCATAQKPPPNKVPMTPPPIGEAPAYSPRGEVTWKDLNGVRPTRRATFDDWRVKGPTLDLVRAGEGRWVGKIRGVEVVFAAEKGRVAGGNIDLALTYDDENNVVVEGLWASRPVKLILGRTSIKGALPTGTIELTDMGSGMFNSYQGFLQISGPPDMPQIVLTMLDAMVP